MKKGILALACAGMIVLSGCYGSYGSTKWLHGAIGKISNKWAKSLVHFLATPAYFICFGFVDFFFVNTIEFWTGSNPFAAGDSYYEKDAQGNSVAAVKNEDGTPLQVVKLPTSLSSAMKTSSVLLTLTAKSLPSTKSKSNQFIDLVFGRSLEIPEGVFCLVLTDLQQSFVFGRLSFAINFIYTYYHVKTGCP